MNASDLFIKSLENEGVEYIFGIPGEENLDLLESIRKSSIQLILTRHEQAAGFMAATYGRLTGKPGVCISTLGPGATNLVTAAAYAYLGAMPMLLITGQKPIKKSKQGRFQIIDVVEMMEPITKHCQVIVHGDRIPSIVRNAFKLATTERPGPVHIELPEDIAQEETQEYVFEPHSPRRPEPDQEAINQALQLMYEAKSPLILLGAGANRKNIRPELLRFFEKTGMYFFTTQMGKGVIDERNEKSLGTAALSDNDYIHCAIDRADLIVNIGHDVIEKPPFFMLPERDLKVIDINFLPSKVDEVYFPQVDIVGDIGRALAHLSEDIDLAKCQFDMSYYQRIKAEIEGHLAERSDSEAFPMLPQRIVADVRKAMPENGIITLDNGMYKIWFARNYKAYEPNSLLLDNALASMGAGLPSAMGAKLVYPERPVMAICGDGGFMMNSQELETAVRLGIDVVVLIINDQGYGMIKWKQEGMGLTDYGLSYQNPDFVKYAESYGAQGYRVETPDQLVEILEKAISQKGVHLIDLPIDYSENIRVFDQELKEKTCIL